MRKPIPKRVEEQSPMDRLKDFTRGIMAVRKDEIADAMEEPIYSQRKPKRKRLRRSTA